MTDAQDFGRRQPAMFLGAAALLGFAASRFLMASATRSTRSAESSETAEDGAYIPESATTPAAGTAGLESGRT
jgi:hypothetical protein